VPVVCPAAVGASAVDMSMTSATKSREIA
jgi:hypothetical protein